MRPDIMAKLHPPDWGIPKPINGAPTLSAIRDQFLDDMEASPGDNSLRLIFVDWCYDNGMSDVAECLRWAAEEKKHARPYFREWVWYDMDAIREMQAENNSSSYSDIPHVVFQGLCGWLKESKTGSRAEFGRAYASFYQAEEALWAAWIEARGKGLI